MIKLDGDWTRVESPKYSIVFTIESVSFHIFSALSAGVSFQLLTN